MMSRTQEKYPLFSTSTHGYPGRLSKCNFFFCHITCILHLRSKMTQKKGHQAWHSACHLSTARPSSVLQPGTVLQSTAFAVVLRMTTSQLRGCHELNHPVTSGHTAGDSGFPLNPNLHFYDNALPVRSDPQTPKPIKGARCRPSLSLGGSHCPSLWIPCTSRDRNQMLS